MSNASTIWQYFANKGLSAPRIAGIMGNLQVESNDDPGAYNAGEGAHGIAQWEGSRWAALQSFAASEGGSPNDLNVQLDFLWHELNTSYSGTLNTIRSSSDPSEVAAAFDSGFEGSAGTTRDQRVSDAQNYLSTYSSSGLAGLATMGAGETLLTGSGSGATAPQTPADYQAALGSLSGLITAVPELNGILQQAVSGGWSTTKFQQAIQQTDWWKTNSDSAKQMVALQANDPAEYHSKLQNAANQILDMGHQMGVTMGWQDVAKMAGQYLIEGWDQNTLQGKIGANWNGSGMLAGQASTIYNQISQAFNDYGVPTTARFINGMVQNVLNRNTTVDTYKQVAMTQAKSMYPSLAQQIDGGATVKDIATPYISQMSNLLELDPNAIQINDPLIKKALQGTTTTSANGSSTATSTPLWQFEQTLRSDPRWSKTQNARDTVSTALVHIGQDFGYSV